MTWNRTKKRGREKSKRQADKWTKNITNGKNVNYSLKSETVNTTN